MSAKTMASPSGADSSNLQMADRQQIRDLLENWVLWRDAGAWDRFATLWHEDGQMSATWFQGPASEFISRSKKAFEAGAVGLHFLGGSAIDINGLRAVAQTKVQIVARGLLHGLEVDVVCQGRFIDAIEKREGRWGLVLRQPVYEWDRMIPVDPNADIQLDRALLASFPVGYRHIAYLQTQLGLEVVRDLPGTRGPQNDALMRRMSRWLITVGSP